MRNYALEDALLMRGEWPKPEITPHLVAERFRKVLTSSPNSWVFADILGATLNQLELRTELTHQDIFTAYEYGIARVASRYSCGEGGPSGPIAHLVLQHIEKDERLTGAVTGNYVYQRFSEAVAKDNIDEAFYRFQSTAYSSEKRQFFTPKDVRDLFMNYYVDDNMRMITEIYETTQDYPQLRSEITPKMFVRAFEQSLEIMKRGTNPEHYAYMAIRMLGFTVGDERLRMNFSSSHRDKLAEFYLQKAEDQKAEKWQRRSALRELDLIETYTLKDPSEIQIASRTHFWEEIYKDRKEIVPCRRDAYLAMCAVKHYKPLEVLGG